MCTKGSSKIYEQRLLISRIESRILKYLNDPKTFCKYSNDMDDIYKSIDEYNPNKKQKMLFVFDDTIADMLSKKINSILTELLLEQEK